MMKSYSYTSVNATSTYALAEWTYKSYSNSKTYVLPDGCRDIIFKRDDDQLEAWFLSDLDKAPYTVEAQEGSKITGIRLRPGVDVDIVRLSSWLKSNNPRTLFGSDQLDEFCRESSNVTDALTCLATGVSSIEISNEITDVNSGASSVLFVAKELGVSVRTLQRLVKSRTGQTPYFWFSLARARKAGRALKSYKSISEAAYHSGYADQAHMTRAMRKWFNKTPHQMRIDPEFLEVISEPGYA